jgi:cytochrome P450
MYWLVIIGVLVTLFVKKRLIDPYLEYKRLVGQQGVSVHPKSKFWPFLGDLPTLLKMQITDANGRHISTNLMTAFAQDARNQLPPKNYADAIYNKRGIQGMLSIANPETVNDLLSVQSKIQDKASMLSDALHDLTGDSFLFSKGDDAWKAKRKAVGPAFYKEKLRKIFESHKGIVQQFMDKWSAGIKEHGSTRIDMRKELKNLYSATIFVSIFGEDFSQEPIHLIDIDTGAPFVKPLFEAMLEVGPPCIQMISHPIRVLCSSRLGTYRFTTRERRIRQNCNSVRAFAFDQIQKRKAGVTKSKLGSSDVLQVLLDNETAFGASNEKDIVDQLMDLFLAGVVTVQNTTLSIIHWSIRRNDVLKKIRHDIDTTVVKGNKTIREALEYELIFEMNYLNTVFQESLRYSNVAQFLTPLKLMEDTVLKPNLHLKKGDEL